MGMGMDVSFEYPMGMGTGIGVIFENGYGRRYSSTCPEPTPIVIPRFTTKNKPRALNLP